MKKDDGITKQIARWVALGALFLIPFTPIIVANAYFFPFISGKAFYFRVLSEMAVVAWVVLAFADKEYRPRFSWIGAAVTAFVVWMFIANLFAINVLKAFWSNFERMEGWVLLAHLLAFFFAASNVLRVEKKWRAWFLTTMAASVYISGYALLQLAGGMEIHQGSTRIDASFGNSAYLAIYLLFNVFVAVWLALTEKHSWLKWSLIALAVLEGVLIFFTETRGTIIGLVTALFLGASLTALTAGKRVRQGALGALVLLVLLTGSFYLARDSAFVQGNHVLQRISSISLNDGKTRFTIWGMAFEGVRERPLVGWGQEGFNYVFNKYYEPSLYGQESWFDRAHNAFIDWLSAGGIPAFLLYVSLFGTAIVLLWRSLELSRPERIALTSVLVGYAVHNLFVFDNIYSYVYFFAVLALIDSQVARTTKLEQAPELTDADTATYVAPIAIVVLCSLLWFVNGSNMQTAKGLIGALSGSPQGIDGNVAKFQDLLSPPGFAAQEIREQLVSLASNIAQNPAATDAQKQQIVSLAITEIKKQVDAYPQDARERLQLAYAYRIVNDSQNSLKEVLAASELSPGKPEMWIEVGIAQWNVGDMKAAQAAFTKAYTLSSQNQRLAAYAAAGHIAVGDAQTANDILLSAYGTTLVDSEILTAAYYRARDWKSLIALSKFLADKQEATVQTWFKLAAAYYAAGDNGNAIATINRAVKLFPEAASSGAEAIKQIQSGVK